MEKLKGRGKRYGFMKKGLIKGIGRDGKFSHIDLERSQVFLDNLQIFVIDIGLVKKAELTYEHLGKKYDLNTFNNLFYEDPKDDFNLKEVTIKNIGDGVIYRYYNSKIELLIIFLKKEITLISYSDLTSRKKIINALYKFYKFRKKV